MWNCSNSSFYYGFVELDWILFKLCTCNICENWLKSLYSTYDDGLINIRIRYATVNFN